MIRNNAAVREPRAVMTDFTCRRSRKRKGDYRNDWMRSQENINNPNLFCWQADNTGAKWQTTWNLPDVW